MLDGQRIEIDDPAAGNVQLSNAQIKRYLEFGDNVSPGEARTAIATVYGGDEKHTQYMVMCTLSDFIDGGKLPIGRTIIHGINELIDASPDAVAAELSTLTEQFYDGKDLGGPQ